MLVRLRSSALARGYPDAGKETPGLSESATMSASGNFGLSDVVGGFGIDRGRFIAWARHPTNAPPTSVLEKLKKPLLRVFSCSMPLQLLLP